MRRQRSPGVQRRRTPRRDVLRRKLLVRLNGQRAVRAYIAAHCQRALLRDRKITCHVERRYGHAARVHDMDTAADPVARDARQRQCGEYVLRAEETDGAIRLHAQRIGLDAAVFTLRDAILGGKADLLCRNCALCECNGALTRSDVCIFLRLNLRSFILILLHLHALHGMHRDVLSFQRTNEKCSVIVAHNIYIMRPCVCVEEAVRCNADAVRRRAERILGRFQRDMRALDMSAGLALLRGHAHSLGCGENNVAAAANRLYGQRTRIVLLDVDAAHRVRIEHAGRIDAQMLVCRADAAAAAVQGKVFRRDCRAGAVDAPCALQVDISLGGDRAEVQRTVLADNIDTLIARQVYFAALAHLHLDGTRMRDFHAVRRPAHLSSASVRECNEILLLEEIGVCNADLAAVLTDALVSSRCKRDIAPDDVRCLDLRDLSRRRIDHALLNGIAQTVRAPAVAVALRERLVVADKGACLVHLGLCVCIRLDNALLREKCLLRCADRTRVCLLCRPARFM